MAPTDKSSHSAGGWSVSYTQGDVDMIREQIMQDQAAKRRFLVLLLMVTGAAMAGAIILLSTSYALYASSETDKKQLAEENGSLKSDLDQCRQQLAAKTAQEQKQAAARTEAQSRLSTLLPSVLRSEVSGTDAANFAKMVYGLPESKLELDSKPPDKLFRNWRVKTDSGVDTYTLVGGFVDGKWVVYSNLVASR